MLKWSQLKKDGFLIEYECYDIAKEYSNEVGNHERRVTTIIFVGKREIESKYFMGNINDDTVHSHVDKGPTNWPVEHINDQVT